MNDDEEWIFQFLFVMGFGKGYLYSYPNAFPINLPLSSRRGERPSNASTNRQTHWTSTNYWDQFKLQMPVIAFVHLAKTYSTTLAKASRLRYFCPDQLVHFMPSNENPLFRNRTNGTFKKEDTIPRDS